MQRRSSANWKGTHEEVFQPGRVMAAGPTSTSIAYRCSASAPTSSPAASTWHNRESLFFYQIIFGFGINNNNNIALKYLWHTQASDAEPLLSSTLFVSKCRVFYFFGLIQLIYNRP